MTNVFPKKLFKRPAKALASKGQNALLTSARQSRILRRLLFAGRGDFDDEFKALAAGQSMFPVNASRAEGGTNYFLRRSIHRLEKGLIMRPRKSCFAKDYIVATVDALSSSLSTLNELELRWAHNVLTEYFAAVDIQGDIAKAQEKFKKLRIGSPSSSGRFTPSHRQAPDALPSFGSLSALLRYRKSTRWFRQVPVPRPLLQEAITAASFAPTACNRQAYYYWVFDDPKLKAELVKLPMGAAGFESNIPVLIAVIGRYRAYSHVRDRHLIYIDASLSIMAFLQALETLGLASCTINWPEIPAREQCARTAIPLEADERIIMFIAVGYADDTGLVPYSPKQPSSVLARFNSES